MKAIIFDFDGVIHDTFALTHDLNAQVLGEKLSLAEYRDFFDGNLYERPEVDENNIREFYKIQEKAYQDLRLEEDIKSHLQVLMKEYSLFIITSNTEATLNGYFHNSEAGHIFKEILGLETHKSKIEKFKIVFEEYGFSKDECLFVTDTLGDILEANKVGVRTIAVDFGFHEKERLEKGEPFKIVSSFDEVVSTIEELQNG